MYKNVYFNCCGKCAQKHAERRPADATKRLPRVNEQDVCCPISKCNTYYDRDQIVKIVLAWLQQKIMRLYGSTRDTLKFQYGRQTRVFCRRWFCNAIYTIYNRSIYTMIDAYSFLLYLFILSREDYLLKFCWSNKLIRN